MESADWSAGGVQGKLAKNTFPHPFTHSLTPSLVLCNNPQTHSLLQSFIAGHGLDFMDIGPSPTEKQYENAVSDKAQKSRFTRPLAAYNAAMDLFNPKDKAPFTLTWFKKIIEGCREMRPDILLLVFTAWSGAAAIPSLLQLPTRVVISYPMPMAPTSSFSVSMAGTGYSSSWRWLNSMQWKISERMIVQKIHLKAAQRNLKLAIEEETAAGRALPGASTTVLDNSMNTASLPALFAFSPSLLPKPTDWPANYHVIGQLTKKKTAADAHKPLPAPLQAYLDDCSKKNLHVIYIGFGSLGFFEKSRVTAILDAAAAAVTKVAAEHPVRAVIQTTLSSTPGKTGTLTSSSSSSSETQPFLTFSESVDHTALFPQTSLVVSHGGVGTVATALAAGKPVLSMCCLPTADQSFWADLCYRQK